MNRTLVLGIGIFIVFCSEAGAGVNATAHRYIQYLDGNQPKISENPFAFMRSAFIASPSFSSHLPLILIESEQDGEVFEAAVSVYDQPELNSVADTPTERFNARVTTTGDVFSKQNYRLNLLSIESGHKAELLGMEPGDEWTLDGMASDKSLLRTYLARVTAASVMPYTPQARYCEVLLKEKYGMLTYRGVYLLSENAWPVQQYASDEDLGAVENVLYSDEADIFLEYSKYIDVDSFINYYILNEFFMNYTPDAYRVYKNAKDKLSIGSMPNFNEAVDNDVYAAYSPEKIYFHRSFWYARLFRSAEFVKTAAERYRELRHSLLLPENVEATIDRIAGYLYPAQKRDWARWGNVYNGPKYRLRDAVESVDKRAGEQVPAIRQVKTYEQELVRLRYLLRRHDLAIALSLSNFFTDAKDGDVIVPSDAFMRNSWNAMTFLTIFFSSILAVRWITR